MMAIQILKEPSSVNDIKNLEGIQDNFELIICTTCGRENKSYWDARYKGMRASCSNCGINWAES